MFILAAGVRKCPMAMKDTGGHIAPLTPTERLDLLRRARGACANPDGTTNFPLAELLAIIIRRLP